MRDINKPLREAYFPALQLTDEAVYYMQAPDKLRGNYIVFKVTEFTENPIKSASYVDATVEVTVYTEGVQYNSGDKADEIIEKALEQIYPENTFVLSLGEDFQMVSTTLRSGRTNSFTLDNQIIAIDRTLIFSHKIFIR